MEGSMVLIKHTYTIKRETRMTPLAQLRAQVAIKMEAVKAETAEKVEIAKLQAKLRTLGNEQLQDAQVRVAITAEASTRLSNLELELESLVSSTPVYNKKTRENRKWTPSRQYGLGNHVQLMSGILSGILYSATEHKSLMLAHTGLDVDIIEETLDAFGSTAYYSENYQEIVPEKPANAAVLKQNLAIIADKLDVNVNLDSINDKAMANRFEIARMRAEKARDEVALTDAIAHQTIEITE